ncbi:TIGR03749 family integrating conjugative element protein [Pseudomonas sp. NPDC077186]|uniref:TIGR03749 family integrating conjugative element protein n=1 Tax=Pseudomonadaceae TaxID=135621 RepID=UPI0012D6BED3|nr:MULTISPECIES: TIGR03749 family integrating conjugative element protein [Pseudomonas]MBI9141215.1 TIGR03749 family integrating conjugative element protein [Pseudomonas aeruginosa]MPT17058.1 TIGR03749 family integrating conjugative element protein [Pseudomonas sp.]WJH57105.1 TIGR03749 family integrating conjugative element protein [Pseudomonas guguanensis]HBO3409693.1 TIGR03749 family integrating conjugative element protein [Pseudomonas aeruginosa]
MNRLLPLALAAFALAPFSAPQATEILRWERLPLALPLVVDQERVVFVERNVRVGVPASLGNRLRVQSAAGAIYLLASEPIEPTRLQLQDADTGTVMLLDIAAEPAQDGQPPLEPVRIIEATSTAAASAADDDSAASAPVRATPQPVILTRYAAQNLYAPLRTVEPVPGVVRVTLRRDLPFDSLLPTLPVQAHALAAWRLDNLWVSAVRLRNHSAHGLDLDPRALQGHFLAATFQHPTLGPRGTPEDTTVVYLVTRGHGLAQALLPAIAPIDAALNLPAPTGGHDAQ